MHARLVASPDACVVGDALDSLVVDGCLKRATFQPPAGSPRLQLPIYAAHAPSLRRRRANLHRQLKAVGAVDATLVLCADADVVYAGASDRSRCLGVPCHAAVTPIPCAPSTLIHSHTLLAGKGFLLRYIGACTRSTHGRPGLLRHAPGCQTARLA